LFHAPLNDSGRLTVDLFQHCLRFLTDLYLRLGVEVFRGRRLVEEAASARRPGAVVLSGRLGGPERAAGKRQAPPRRKQGGVAVQKQVKRFGLSERLPVNCAGEAQDRRDLLVAVLKAQGSHQTTGLGAL
jgi:hypothetical protein